MIFSVDEDRSTRGEVWIRVKVVVVAVGIRKERDKGDIYKVAQKLVDRGIIPNRGSD